MSYTLLMNKDDLKQHCKVQEEDGVEIGAPKRGTKIVYKERPVIEIDFTNNMLITADSAERLGEHTMKSKDWAKVEVYAKKAS